MYNRNSVLLGDCLELMQDIKDKSIDMILCDLPYGTTACKWDVIIPFEQLWKQYERIIKDNGAIVLTASQPFASALIMSNPKLFKYEWIWNKSQGSSPLNANYQPNKVHENILVFSKSSSTYSVKGSMAYYPIKTKGKPYISGGYDGDEKYHGFTSKGGTVNMGDRYPTTIIDFKKIKDKLHPTQKPVALFEYLIKTYTNEGETVLDNCAGSGTTAIACINTNRSYILMEKEEKYYNIIRDRIEKHSPQLKLAGQCTTVTR